MPAPRAYWKGYLKLSFVSCPIALYPATSAAERLSFRQVNRRTGHRLKHKLVDSVTGEAVDSSNKARGYEVGENEFLLVEDRDLERARSERPPPGAVPLVEAPSRESPPTVPAGLHEQDEEQVADDAADEDDEEQEIAAPEAKRPAHHAAPVKPSRENVVNLMDALRRSIAAKHPAKATPRRGLRKSAGPKRPAQARTVR